VDITYRSAKCEDLEDAERVVQEAGNELRVRHGRQPWPVPPPILPSGGPRRALGRRTWRHDRWLWLQLDDGEVLVFVATLCWPQTQAKGVGQALLSKTLMQAQRNGATNRALITPAYNITSTRLYLNTRDEPE